jgi:Zn finger protein HypA/HybF involved in hydrogenase expression
MSLKCPACGNGISHHSQRLGYADWVDYMECDQCHKKFEISLGSEIDIVMKIEKK